MECIVYLYCLYCVIEHVQWPVGEGSRTGVTLSPVKEDSAVQGDAGGATSAGPWTITPANIGALRDNYSTPNKSLDAPEYLMSSTAHTNPATEVSRTNSIYRRTGN